MAGDARFEEVDAALDGVLDELRGLEPILHTPEFGATAAELERRMAPGYWEVGASGRRYSREFILRMFAQDPAVDAAREGWVCSGFGLRRLGERTFLLTYTLSQGDRVTRRATVWERGEGGWRVVFHQGTVVSAAGDDVLPQVG